MIQNTLGLDRIESTILKVCDFVDKQKNANSNWTTFHEQYIWKELVSCILGSRVRYETAKACVAHLDKSGLLNVTKILKNPLAVKKKIFLELSRPIYPPFTHGVGCKYRYPKSKSEFVVSTAIQLYDKNSQAISDILRTSRDGIDARETLIKNCKGIGPKQASLFLRNIRFTDDLAILDCHVDHYIDLMRLAERYKNVNTEKMHPYFRKEIMLRIYAISKKKSLATMDIGIWTVMQLIEKEATF